MDWKTQNCKDINSPQSDYITPIKVSGEFFVHKEGLTIKFIWKGIGTRIAKTILEKKIEVGGLILHNIKVYYVGTSLAVQ